LNQNRPGLFKNCKQVGHNLFLKIAYASIKVMATCLLFD